MLERERERERERLEDAEYGDQLWEMQQTSWPVNRILQLILKLKYAYPVMMMTIMSLCTGVVGIFSPLIMTNRK
jgi:hypothetical protein